MKRLIFLTGRPGVGKTTVLLGAVEDLKKRGFKIGGVISQEIREEGIRVGFKIVDLDTKREGWLAHVRQPKGPMISKYRVCLEDLESICAEAILDAVRKADIIIIDEVGPMELCSQAFKEAVEEALESRKTVLGTIHYRAKDPLITTIKNRTETTIIEVTPENREGLPGIIAQEVSESLRKG